MARARDWMVETLRTVPEDLSLTELLEEMYVQRVSGMPVRDATGECVGVVTRTDVVDYFHRRTYVLGLKSSSAEERAESTELPWVSESATVRDVMIPRVLRVHPDDPMQEVAAQMAEHGVHRMFVHDGERIVGVISTLDLARYVASPPPAE